MRRVLKRYLVRDPSGRALSMQSERLTDDGRGTLQLTSERSAAWCSGCRRPVTDISELRGSCDVCQFHGCCVHCLSHCRVCSRRLCGRCRLGFAGPPAITVCSVCQRRLLQRQALQDQLLVQQAIFDREIARNRHFHQVQTLQLQAERLRQMAELQAARLGGQRRPPLIWVFNGVRWTLAKVIQHAQRALR